MIRLPLFRYRSPATLREAVEVLAGEGPDAMLLAGGTDLLPNMKRRQQVPKVLVGLGRLDSLRTIRSGDGDGGFSLGCRLTLAELAEHPVVRSRFSAVWQAAGQIASPQIRNRGTLGGNLCLDTRCNYYNQSYEWRKAIRFCLKRDGDLCWVATGSPKCLAVSSTDLAPALTALGARARLLSRSGERTVPLEDLYRNDGIEYMVRQPDEILTEVLLDAGANWRSAYWKLRRRGSIDFPVLSVGAAARIGPSGTVEESRVVLGAVASCPLVVREAGAFLAGKPLDEATIREASRIAARAAKPMDNTDFDLHWRKGVAAELVTWALRELRGDDMRPERRQLNRGQSP